MLNVLFAGRELNMSTKIFAIPDRDSLGYTEEELIKEYPNNLMEIEKIHLFDFSVKGYEMLLQKSTNYPDLICIILKHADNQCARYFMKLAELKAVLEKYPYKGLGYTQQDALKCFHALAEKCFPWVTKQGGS